MKRIHLTLPFLILAGGSLIWLWLRPRDMKV